MVAGQREGGNAIELVAEVQNLLPDLQEVSAHLELGSGVIDIAKMDDHIGVLIGNLPQDQFGGVLAGAPVAQNRDPGLGRQLAVNHEVAQVLIDDIGNLLLLGHEVLGIHFGGASAYLGSQSPNFGQTHLVRTLRVAENFRLCQFQRGQRAEAKRLQ